MARTRWLGGCLRDHASQGTDDDQARAGEGTDTVLGANWSRNKNMEPIRVFVVDDHPMIRHGIAAMLASERDMRCVGDAADGAEATRTACGLQPDVVVVDQLMPRMDGVATIAALRARMPQARFVLLTAALEPAEVKRAVAAGAAGFLLKNATTHDLVAAIRNAHQSPGTLAPEVSEVLTGNGRDHKPGADLTQRERELLALMARGKSNHEIAAALTIAMPTVKFHVTNILAKLQADNRTEAVLVALRHKLVRLE
jgi:NarL family two-component system response regulator LiaR